MHSGSLEDMTNLIRKLPGHVLKIKWRGGGYPEGTYILSQVSEDEDLTFISATMPAITVYINSKELNHRCENLEKIGYIGPYLEDDWLCHDNNCGPKKITGCVDCPYSKKVGANFFYPGDECYDPIWKKKYKIKSVHIGLKLTGGEDLGWEKVFDLYSGGKYEIFTPGKHPILSSLMYTNDFMRILDAKYYGLVKKEYITPVYLYGLDTKFSRKTLMEFNDLRRAKRCNFIIDLEQIDWICKELCLYGIGSEQCKTCKTEQIKHDLSRDHKKV